MTKHRSRFLIEAMHIMSVLSFFGSFLEVSASDASLASALEPSVGVSRACCALGPSGSSWDQNGSNSLTHTYTLVRIFHS